MDIPHSPPTLPANGRPWYRDISTAPPYRLYKKLSANNENTSPFRSLALFPWDVASLDTLWNGTLHTNEFYPHWDAMILEFSNAIALASPRQVLIYFLLHQAPPIRIEIPGISDVKVPPNYTPSITWALNIRAPLEPLLLISNRSLLYVFNVRKKVIMSYLRGHGGAITSIAIHPSHPHLFCTTSRDFTTRIYDLRLSPQLESYNTHWPPGSQPSRAGAAHGLHTSESEGIGSGRCIAILMGGRSGGHQAAVLAAAFHPVLPLIATCGMDRAVKIWHFRPLSESTITREDKPLFSSARIHKGRVLSVTWLRHDLLVTHGAPAIMHQKPENSEKLETYLEPGQLVIWRWLSIDRFFPLNHEENTSQAPLRGCASDYQESSSFTIISAMSFPPVDSQYLVSNIHVHQEHDHDPLVLFTCPASNVLRMLNVAHLKPRIPPKFPLDDPAKVAESAKRLRVDGSGVIDLVSCHPAESMFWFITLPNSDSQTTFFHTCTMTRDAKAILAIGTDGILWVWRLYSSTNESMCNSQL